MIGDDKFGGDLEVLTEADIAERPQALDELNRMPAALHGRQESCSCDGAVDTGCENCWSDEELRLNYRQLFADRAQSLKLCGLKFARIKELLDDTHLGWVQTCLDIEAVLENKCSVVDERMGNKT